MRSAGATDAVGSVDLGDVDQVLPEDAPRFGHEVVGHRERRDLDVGGDRPDAHLSAEVAADDGLDLGTTTLGVVLEEGLGLREAERDDIAIDSDRAALAQDRARRRPGRPDDRSTSR